MIDLLNQDDTLVNVSYASEPYLNPDYEWTATQDEVFFRFHFVRLPVINDVSTSLSTHIVVMGDDRARLRFKRIPIAHFLDDFP